MFEHIEWAHASHALPVTATPGWIAQESDDGNSAGDWGIVLDAGSSSMVIYGSPEQLITFASQITARAAYIRIRVAFQDAPRDAVFHCPLCDIPIPRPNDPFLRLHARVSHSGATPIVEVPA